MTESVSLTTALFIAHGHLNDLRNTVGSDKYEIIVEHSTAPSPDMFQNGIVVDIGKISDNNYRVQFAGKHNLNRILNILMAVGMVIHSINRHSESLEDMFVQKILKNDN